MINQAKLNAEMQQAQIESVKADTRRTLALAREIELRNQQTEQQNTSLGTLRVPGLPGLQAPQRRC